MAQNTDNPDLNSAKNSDKNTASQNSVTFALAQSHYLVGDIAGNVEKMRTLALQARDQGADVIVFPELA